MRAGDRDDGAERRKRTFTVSGMTREGRSDDAATRRARFWPGDRGRRGFETLHSSQLSKRRNS